jgi:hypothetical protein
LKPPLSFLKSASLIVRPHGAVAGCSIGRMRFMVRFESEYVVVEIEVLQCTLYVVAKDCACRLSESELLWRYVNGFFGFLSKGSEMCGYVDLIDNKHVSALTDDVLRLPRWGPIRMHLTHKAFCTSVIML